MPHFIAEDFRFSTNAEVDNYSFDELIRKPHVSGFELTQLIDQIAGQVLTVKAGQRFTLFVRAPGGTALWLAKHLSTNDQSNELVISVESPYCDKLLLNELNELPIVVDAFQDADDYFSIKYAHLTDCSILACRLNLLDWLTSVERSARLYCQPIIALDPNRQLAAREPGDYFMGSSVWTNLQKVTDGN